MSNFEKIYGDSIIPKRGTADSAGYDFYAHEEGILNPGERKLIKTGVSCKLEKNEFLAVVPRSGLALKKGITVLNAPGIVDSDYYPNEIGVILYNTSKEGFEIKFGDRIAQGIIMEYKKTKSDNAEGNRNGGFGSTDEVS